MYEVKPVGPGWFMIFWMSSRGRIRAADNIGYPLRQNANRRKNQLNSEILGECPCGEPATIEDSQSGQHVCPLCWLKLHQTIQGPDQAEALTAHLSAYVRPSTLALLHQWCEAHSCSLSVALELFLPEELALWESGL